MCPIFLIWYARIHSNACFVRFEVDNMGLSALLKHYIAFSGIAT
jgi:hypothetical protein